MPPADDQQNVNLGDAQPQGMPSAMPPAADGGPAPMQPTVISPTTGPDDTSAPAVAAPGFGSLPDSPAPVDDVPAAAAPSPFDVPSASADVPPAVPAVGDVPSVPSAPTMGDVPPAAPEVPADAPDASDVPTFPPAA